MSYSPPITAHHPLGHQPRPEHEEGVGEEVGGVQHAQQRLGPGLVLSIDLCDPRPGKKKINLRKSSIGVI